MTFILIVAECDGDYIPDNHLFVERLSSKKERRLHICEYIERFLGKNCLLDSCSGELQLTDFSWTEDMELPVKNVEEFMAKVKSSLKSKKSFKCYTDDDASIELKCSATDFRISYNQAPNGNSWSHIDFELL